MSAIFYDVETNNPVKLEIDPVTIQAGTGFTPIPYFKPTSRNDGYFRPFANQQLNSRLAVALPETAWEIRWKAELGQGFLTTFVLQAVDRFMVQQEGAWQLFNFEGANLGRGARGEGDVVVDPINRLFYFCDNSGLITAGDLSNGNEKFAMFAYFGKGFRRTVISRFDKKMMILSLELPVMSAREYRNPEYAIIEVQDAGNIAAKDEDGILTSAHRVASLMSRTRPFLMAVNENTLALATLNHVFLANAQLHITANFQEEFTPLAVSLDEATRIYLIVRTKEDRRVLWVLTPKGEQIVNVDIPVIPGEAYTPPIVGYDHNIYLTLKDRILAIDQQGKVLWRQHAGGTIGGAVVTADDQLLVAAGSAITAFDAKGERKLLHFFEGETLSTPPILTDQGVLLVASQRQLYCLAPKGRR